MFAVPCGFIYQIVILSKYLDYFLTLFRGKIKERERERERKKSGHKGLDKGAILLRFGNKPVP